MLYHVDKNQLDHHDDDDDDDDDDGDGDFEHDHKNGVDHYLHQAANFDHDDAAVVTVPLLIDDDNSDSLDDDPIPDESLRWLWWSLRVL